MKGSTIEFIFKLLRRELESEIVQDNPKPLEVEYVKDLIDSSLDFCKNYGQIYDYYDLKSKINELLENK